MGAAVLRSLGIAVRVAGGVETQAFHPTAQSNCNFWVGGTICERCNGYGARALRCASRRSTIAELVRPSVYDSDEIKDSEYCCPKLSISVYLHATYFFFSSRPPTAATWILYPSEINVQLIQFLLNVGVRVIPVAQVFDNLV